MAHTTPERILGHAELEHQLGVLMRRSRGVSGSLARAVHPEVDAAAYGLMVRIDEIGSVRITDLAEYLSVGKPTVSRQITLLERLGLVARTVDDGDARSRQLSLTDQGRALLAAARDARREHIAAQLADWPLDDVTRLATLLRRFNTLPSHPDPPVTP